jgi:integrase
LHQAQDLLAVDGMERPLATFAKRGERWRAQVRRNGHTLSKSFRLKTDAEIWAREMERSIDRDLVPSLQRTHRSNTFGSLIDLHRADLASVNKPLRRSKRAVLERLDEELGSTPINNLTREKLIAYGRERAKAGAGPATLAIDISFIGTVLTHAAAVHGYKVDTEAVRLARVGLRRLGLVGASQERDRRPTDDELRRLFVHFDAIERTSMPMTRIVKFAIATAMRIEEICRIEWETLDPRTRTILVPDRKDPRKKVGNNQRVPLLAASGYDAYQLLLNQRTLRLNPPQCFPYNPKSAGTAFRRACRCLSDMSPTPLGQRVGMVLRSVHGLAPWREPPGEN